MHVSDIKIDSHLFFPIAIGLKPAWHLAPPPRAIRTRLGAVLAFLKAEKGETLSILNFFLLEVTDRKDGEDDIHPHG